MSTEPDPVSAEALDKILKPVRGRRATAWQHSAPPELAGLAEDDHDHDHNHEDHDDSHHGGAAENNDQEAAANPNAGDDENEPNVDATAEPEHTAPAAQEPTTTSQPERSKRRPFAVERLKDTELHGSIPVINVAEDDEEPDNPDDNITVVLTAGAHHEEHQLPPGESLEISVPHEAEKKAPQEKPLKSALKKTDSLKPERHAAPAVRGWMRRQLSGADALAQLKENAEAVAHGRASVITPDDLDIERGIGKEGVLMFNALLTAARKDVGAPRAWSYKAPLFKCIVKAKNLISHGIITQEELEGLHEPLNRLGNLLLDLLQQKKMLKGEQNLIKPTLFATLLKDVLAKGKELLAAHMDAVELEKAQPAMDYYSDVNFVANFLNDPGYTTEKRMMKQHARLMLRKILKPQCARPKCKTSRARPKGSFPGSRLCARHHHERVLQLYAPPANFDYFLEGDTSDFKLTFHDYLDHQELRLGRIGPMVRPKKQPGVKTDGRIDELDARHQKDSKGQFSVQPGAHEGEDPVDEDAPASGADDSAHPHDQELKKQAEEEESGPPKSLPNSTLIHFLLNVKTYREAVTVKERQKFGPVIYERYLRENGERQIHFLTRDRILMDPIDLAFETGLAHIKPGLFNYCFQVIEKALKAQFEHFVHSEAYQQALREIMLPEELQQQLLCEVKDEQDDDKAWESNARVTFSDEVQIVGYSERDDAY